MSKGFAVVIGMTIAYVASFLGMFFAYYHYKHNKSRRLAEKSEQNG
jgi:F0F1-type ATP synthase assembly protein I